MIITSLTWNWMHVVDIFKILLPIISESFQKQDHTFFTAHVSGQGLLQKRGHLQPVISGAWEKKHTYKSVAFSPADCFQGAKYVFHSIKSDLVQKEDRVARILVKLPLMADECSRRAGHEGDGEIILQQRGCLKGRESMEMRGFETKFRLPSSPSAPLLKAESAPSSS